MKAILVIDIPEDYIGGEIDINIYCKNNKVIHEKYVNKLKSMPTRKRKIKELQQYTKEYEAYCKGEVDGWNFCLDEILGEEE